MIPEELRRRLAMEHELTLQVKAIPKASRNEISVLPDGSLRVKITAAPERGKANVAICEMLAQEFGVPRRNVEILRGETSHNKTVKITAS